MFIQPYLRYRPLGAFRYRTLEGADAKAAVDALIQLSSFYKPKVALSSITLDVKPGRLGTTVRIRVNVDAIAGLTSGGYVRHTDRAEMVVGPRKARSKLVSRTNLDFVPFEKQVEKKTPNAASIARMQGVAAVCPPGRYHLQDGVSFGTPDLTIQLRMLSQG